jgi:hypothetical protein
MKTPKMKPTNGWAVVDKDGDVWFAASSGACVRETVVERGQEISSRFSYYAPFAVVHVTITQRKAKP